MYFDEHGWLWRAQPFILNGFAIVSPVISFPYAWSISVFWTSSLVALWFFPQSFVLPYPFTKIHNVGCLVRVIILTINVFNFSYFKFYSLLDAQVHRPLRPAPRCDLVHCGCRKIQPIREWSFFTGWLFSLHRHVNCKNWQKCMSLRWNFLYCRLIFFHLIRGVCKEGMAEWQRRLYTIVIRECACSFLFLWCWRIYRD